MLEPNDFGSGICNSFEFNFGWRFCNCLLFLWWPWNQIRAKKNAIATAGTLIIWAPCPIGIRLSSNLSFWGRRELQANSRSVLEIAKNLLHYLPMRHLGTMHKLAHFSYNKGEVDLVNDRYCKEPTVLRYSNRIIKEMASKSTKFLGCRHWSLYWFSIFHVGTMQ